MRRRFSEQPRMVAAQLLVAIVLVGAGYAIVQIAGDDDKVPAATATALDRARSESRQDRRALREQRSATGRLRSLVARERRRSASLRRRARELQGALSRARGALARERARNPAGALGQ